MIPRRITQNMIHSGPEIFVNFIIGTFENANNLSQNVMNNSFQEEEREAQEKPTSKAFINKLKTITIDDSNKYTCLICMETFKEGDTCIQLPCPEQSHYFHDGSNPEICEGILPWLTKNNTCPTCRTEFPEEISSEESEETETNQEQFNREYEEMLQIREQDDFQTEELNSHQESHEIPVPTNENDDEAAPISLEDILQQREHDDLLARETIENNESNESDVSDVSDVSDGTNEPIQAYENTEIQRSLITIDNNINHMDHINHINHIDQIDTIANSIMNNINHLIRTEEEELQHAIEMSLNDS